MEDRTRFGLGVLLTAIAGWVDAIGFISLGGFYVSFMSGNTTQLGIGLTHVDMSLVRVPAVLLACFVLGALVATLVYALSGRWQLPAILLLEGVLLGFALAFSFFQTPMSGTTATLAMAMGTQNAALRSDRGDRVGGTFVTGTVFGLGETLALWTLGRSGPRPALRHAVAWLALAFGAAAGAWAFSAYGLFALAVPAGCILAVAGVTGLMVPNAGLGKAAEKRSDEPP